MVGRNREQSELLGFENCELLRKHEHDAPQVRNQPRVDALVSSVSRHQNLRHRWQQSLQRELLQVRRERIFVNVDDLVGRVRAVDFNHLVPVAHCFVVRVVHARLDIAQQQSLLPLHEPFPRRVLGFLHGGTRFRRLRCFNRNSCRLFFYLFNFGRLLLRGALLLSCLWLLSRWSYYLSILLSIFRCLFPFIILVILICSGSSSRLRCRFRLA